MRHPLSWPAAPPASGGVCLRPFEPQDVAMVCELSTDPCVSQTSSLPLDAGEAAALGWIERQHDRLAEGAGFSFCAVDRTSGTPVGTVGLWTRGFPGGRVSAGYSSEAAHGGCHSTVSHLVCPGKRPERRRP